METYLDLYHINTIHPGLKKIIDISKPDSVSWLIEDWFSSQSVKINLEAKFHQAAEAQEPNKYANYLKFIKCFVKEGNQQKSEFTITWFALYPNIMIEFYPFNMVVSIAKPVSATETTNIVEFYAHKSLLASETGKEMHAAFKKDYLETADEDTLACVRMQEGRHALYRNGKNLFGPYHKSLETGTSSFHKFYQTQLA